MEIKGFESWAGIEVGQTNKTILRKLGVVWRGAIREFVRAVVQEILIDTGMSLGSLEPLAAQVRTKTSVSVRKSEIKKRVGGRYKGGPRKTYELGVSYGQGAYSISYPSGVSDPNFEFKFDIVVYQHLLKENGIGRGSSFPQTMEAGLAAFEDYWERESAYVVENEYSTLIA